MAKELNKVSVGLYESHEAVYELSEEINTIKSGDWYLIPNGINSISIMLVLAGSSRGRVDITTDTVENVHNGNPAYLAWSLGTITGTRFINHPPVTAIRQVNERGTTKLLVRCQ